MAESKSRGSAVNDAGQVVGWSYLPNDSAAHAFLVDGGPMMDLGTVSGWSNSYATGINAAGTIVGNSSESGTGGPFVGSAGGRLVDLNTYIDTFLQIVTRATAINDAGQILADGITDNFMENEYLLTPGGGTPTPTPIPRKGQLANISTRLEVGSADNVLIAGFISQGPTGSTNQVVVRGIGPSLAGSGISNSLVDPTWSCATRAAR